MKMIFQISLFLVILGCSKTESPKPGLPVSVRTESIVGCRAPSEPGCSSCEMKMNSACTTFSWLDAPGGSGAEPWYNVISNFCSGAPLNCARCSIRAERAYKALSQNPVCRCEGVNTGTDPCFHPESCACFCRRFIGLKSACGTP